MLRPFITAFSGTIVEFFETMAIAYAILRAGYAREAISATIMGQFAVLIAAVFLWPLHQFVPIFWLRLTAALLLSATGFYWILKSVRRKLAGRRPRWVDDPLGKVGVQPHETGAGFSLLVFLVMFKSSVVEGLEVLLVVFPIGASTGQWPAILCGTALAIAAVVFGVMLLHGQLKKVPEVTLKLAIGVVLLLIGITWLVELRA